ncbi:MAG: hypothetical protein EOP54_31070 [Sphingobacteriales bacterium]|nr:MAG: hypothetical protein EOP54_31070 [Sphingobacteriales bacterium]
MKKIAMMAFLAVAMVSCGDDDATVTTGADLSGTWKLTSLTMPNPADGNGDGAATTDLFVEGSACFAESTLVFGANNTLVNNLSFSLFDDDCMTASAPGTYAVNGNSVVATINYDGETEVYSYTKNGNTLTIFEPDFFEIEIGTSGGGDTASVDATMVYTKQ